jgi:SAM-dependent methyltransferase
LTDEERIRAAYANYGRSGRNSLWDLTNEGYARLVRERDAVISDLLTRSVRDGPARVLDVGCGDGRLGQVVNDVAPGADYAGIDLLPDQIEQARALVPEGEFEVGSVDRLPYPDAAFDVVVAMTLFSSIQSRTMEVSGASEIGRVIRPGGWLIWFDLRYDNPSNAAVHGLSERRVAELFPGWHRELRSFTLLPPIARRLGRTTSVLYPPLHAIPPLRSHLIGRLRCPT